jgi:plastocyanin
MARWMVVLLTVAIVAGVIVSVSPKTSGSASPINLYGSVSSGWGLAASSESIPGPTVTAVQGEAVTIVLHSTDGISHEFFVDLNGNGRPDPGEPTSAAFSSQVTITFTAATAGTFVYYCAFHPSSMKGTFIVTPANGMTPSYGTSGTGGSALLLGGVIAVIAGVAGATIFIARRKR